jgi:hypothetical protein
MVLPPLTYPGNVLAPYAKAININDRIMAAYLGDVLPGKLWAQQLWAQQLQLQ